MLQVCVCIAYYKACLCACVCVRARARLGRGLTSTASRSPLAKPEEAFVTPLFSPVKAHPRKAALFQMMCFLIPQAPAESEEQAQLLKEGQSAVF